MRVTKEEVVFEGKYLRMVEKSFETRLGKNHVWETVERTTIGNRGAVVVVALTKEREVILERNWRVPAGSFVIQLPAGLSDVERETQEEAARRELLEETGYRANKLIPIIVAPEDPVLTPTQLSHFFAPGVEFAEEPKSDTTEQIEVLKVPIAELRHFLLNLPENTMLDLRVPGIIWILESMRLI
ncbi:MAG: NUDIX hydrolase [Dehalococcoidia bacterium]|nr:NUDIX hydrolase [Dehalococcoidia bacterium]